MQFSPEQNSWDSELNLETRLNGLGLIPEVAAKMIKYFVTS